MQVETRLRLVENLSRIVDPSAVDATSAGISLDDQISKVIVSPTTPEEAAQVLKFADQNNFKVAIRGGGTRDSLGNPLGGLDFVLSTARLAAIFEYSPADLMVGVQAGMKLADLQAELEKQGQFLPLESPALGRGATVGGAIATNSSGPARLNYGPARDWLIGLKFALPNGTLAKGGGRVVKNVAGFDMMKLFIGSLGTLGLIYEMNFKLMPLPAAFATLIADFDSYEKASQTALKIIDRGCFPTALTILDQAGAHAVELPALKPATLLVELRNTTQAVERQVSDVAAICEETSAKIERVQERADQKKLWDSVTDFGYRELAEPAFALKVSTLPDQTAALLTFAHQQATTQEIELAAIGHVGHGISWLTGKYSDEGQALDFILQLMAWAESKGGSVAAERVNLSLKRRLPDVWGTALSEGELKLMRRLKNELDPNNTLNPGRFVGKL